MKKIKPTLSTLRVNVPAGNILANVSLKSSDLVSALSSHINVMYAPDIAYVDLYPTSDAAVIYLNEVEIASGNSYRKRIVQLAKNLKDMRGIVILQKASNIIDQLIPIQKFVVLELGLCCIITSSCQESAKYLSNMCYLQCESYPNPYKIKRKTASIDLCMLEMLKVIPHLGDSKGKLLLQKFKNIKSISTASEEELSGIIGKRMAHGVYNFFNHIV